jgi:exodeoxyribonuclease-5/exodeoxyribonuclease V alpha subunit
LDDEILEFNAIIEKEVRKYDDFKIYAVSPIDNKDKIKYNKYNNVSISGDIQELSIGMQYKIKGKENKWGYDILNIQREKPTTKTQVITFLSEVITQNQAKTLLSVYPDIVEKVINNDLDDVDLRKTKFIKNKIFNTIKNKIIENFPLIDFINEFKEYGINISLARKMYIKFTSIERMREKMKNDPYKTLCSISGIAFKKSDQMILSVEENKHLINSLQRISACIEFCLTENENNGNTWMSLEDLSNKANELTPESIDLLIDGLLQDNIYIDKINRRIAFKTSYQIELYIADVLSSMLHNSRKLIIDTSKYHIVDGCKLSEEQQNVLVNFCNNNVSLLVGNAGSGKSFCTQSIINLCDDNDLSYILMTPTGKSANVLSDYTNRDAGTIHRKLGYNPSQGWGFNEDNKLDCDVVIVDENGMTDIFLMKHLLEAIDINKTRILFVQDDAQLPSVSCGNCAFDLIHSGVIPITRLTKVFRYGEGGLSQIATKIRNGEKYIDNSCDDIQSFGTNQDYSLIPIEDDYMMDYITGIYERLLNEGNNPLDILVLSAKNINENGTIEINKVLQQKINPPQQDKPYAIYGENIYRINDIVMQCKNNYKAINEIYEEVTITNGEIGRIVNIGYNEISIQYKRDLITYEKSDLSEIQLAYCISIHRSQGSGVKNVILVTPSSHKWNLNKNLLYVGVTRAKSKCFHLSLPSTINFAIKKSIELERNTFLKDLLIEKYKDKLKI